MLRELIKKIKDEIEWESFVNWIKKNKEHGSDNLEEDVIFMLEKSDYVNNVENVMEEKVWISVEEFPKQEEVGLNEYLNIMPQ